MAMKSPRSDEQSWTCPPGSLTYIGNSMSPTLKAPEIIYFVPYGKMDVRPGDVVVFDNPLEGRSVTHRVISVTAEGIKTRGDNNNEIDPWILSKDDIDGQVIIARSDRRYRRIHGGWSGRLRVAFTRIIRYMGIIRKVAIANLNRRLFRLIKGRKPALRKVSRGTYGTPPALAKNGHRETVEVPAKEEQERNAPR